MRIASLPSRAWKWRIASFCAIWAPGSPVQAETLRHRIGDQLRPAFAPEIVGDLGAVGIGDEPAHLVRPLGDVAVNLAGAINRVRRTALDPAAMDMAGLDETDADVSGDGAHRLAPAGDSGDRLLVHAVLQ